MNDHTPTFSSDITKYAPWVTQFGLSAPYGECQCGCGQLAPIARWTERRKGWLKGGPQRFINNHHTRRKLVDRFWEKVNKNGPIHPILGTRCWLWLGSTNSFGYGELREGKTLHKAHRFSYELHYGPIPVGEGIHGTCVLHRCDQPPCCNPDHLFLGTQTDNMHDMAAKGRANKTPDWIHKRGEENSRAKLTEDEVREIRLMCANGMIQKDVAVLFGVGKAAISDIVRRKNWSHLE